MAVPDSVRVEVPQATFLAPKPRLAMSASSAPSSPSSDSSASDATLSTESASASEAPTREEMVALLEDLADRVRHDNINVRLVLTALAAAIHTGEERDLSRHVAAFDPTRRTRAVQNRLLMDALKIINGR